MEEKLLEILDQRDTDALTVEAASEAIVTVFRQYPNETSLRLKGNGINDARAQILAIALRHPDCHLLSLNLIFHIIGDLGAQALAQAISNPNCKLQSLNLSYNRIGPQGAKELAFAIQHKGCNLLSLDLEDNNIDDAGQALAIALRNPHCSVLELRVSFYSVSREIRNFFQESLEYSRQRWQSECLFYLASACFKKILIPDLISIILRFAADHPPPSFMTDKSMDDPKIVSIPQHVVSKIRENAKKWNKKISFFNYVSLQQTTQQNSQLEILDLDDVNPATNKKQKKDEDNANTDKQDGEWCQI